MLKELNPMTRKEKLLSFINADGRGLEIGPFHTPIAPKREHYNVQIIDKFERIKLLEIANIHHLSTEEIEDVDFIWKGETYCDLTGKSHYYDWIIASHVIEHVPDLFTFLKNCENVLKLDGKLSLAIPDKRYCFDRFRPITGLAKVIDSYIQNTMTHSTGTAFEYFLNVVTLAGQIAWQQGAQGEYAFVHPIENIKNMQSAIASNRKGTYDDFHAWVFTPTSFRLLINDLRILGFTEFHEVSFYPTEGCEFFIALSQQGEAPKMDRLQMLKQIQEELKNG